jgi:hypothetical protein
LQGFDIVVEYLRFYNFEPIFGVTDLIIKNLKTMPVDVEALIAVHSAIL